MQGVFKQVGERLPEPLLRVLAQPLAQALGDVARIGHPCAPGLEVGRARGPAAAPGRPPPRKDTVQRCPSVCSCSCSSSSRGSSDRRTGATCCAHERRRRPRARGRARHARRARRAPARGELPSAAARARGSRRRPARARARARAGGDRRARRSSTRCRCRPSARRGRGWPISTREREVQAAVDGAQPRAALPPHRRRRPVRARGLARAGARDPSRLGRGRAGRRRAVAARARAAVARRPRGVARSGSATAPRRCARRSASPRCSAGAARRCCARSSCCARALDLDQGRLAHAAIELRARATRPRSASCRAEGRQDLALRIAELEQLREPASTSRRRRRSAARAGRTRPATSRRAELDEEVVAPRARAPGGGAARAHRGGL